MWKTLVSHYLSLSYTTTWIVILFSSFNHGTLSFKNSYKWVKKGIKVVLTYNLSKTHIQISLKPKA